MYNFTTFNDLIPLHHGRRVVGVCACGLQPKGRGFESTSRHCVATLDKLLTQNCLRGRQRETTSLISSPGGVKAHEPAFGQRTIIIIINDLCARGSKGQHSLLDCQSPCGELTRGNGTEIYFKISVPFEPRSPLSCDEYTDHRLSVGR